MIDWYSVSFSALWIVGLSLVTTGLSLANYLGRHFNQRFRHALKMPACRNLIGYGMVLFCIGLAGSVTILWEQILWAILALVFTLRILKTRNMADL